MTNRRKGNLSAALLSPVRAVAVAAPSAAETTWQRARLILLIHLGIAALTTGIVGYAAVFAVPGVELVNLYCGFLLSTFAWSVGSWYYVRRTVFDLYGMFVILAFLFHGSYALLRLIGAEEAIYLLPDLQQSILASSILAVFVGFTALHLGALLAESRRSPIVDRTASGEEPAMTRESAESVNLMILGILLVMISLPSMIIEVREGVGLVSAGGYRALFLDESSGGPLRLIGNLARDFYLTGAFFLMAAGKRRPFVLAVSLALVGMLAAYNLYLGHRAYAVLPVLAAIWLWHHSVRKLPLVLLSVPGIAALIYALSIVRQLRGLVGGARASISDVQGYFTSIPDAAISLLGEAGGTLMTVGYTIELVPSVRPFEAGGTYLGAIVNAVPMLHWARPYGFGSDWLAWTVKPEWAASGFGFGYSFLAEAYLNFGWIGIPLVCVLIGFGAVSLVRWAGSDAARLVVVAVFVPAFLFFARGESVDLFRPLLWRGLLPYLGLVLTLKLSQRMSVRVSDPTRLKPTHGNDESF